MIDESATRAAAQAIYEGRTIDLTAEVLARLGRGEIVGESRPVRRERFVFPREMAPLPPPPPPMPSVTPRVDAGQIETILRSAPQICVNCRLLSNADPTPCPSPRGHYFVTDYTAMAQKIRDAYDR